ncbi:MAG: acetyl-CoA carboxylase biotin carboxyl carrier protein [Terriglobales bacterium]
MPMDWDKIRKLIEGLTELLRARPGSEGLEEIEVQEGDLRIRVRRGGAVAVAPAALATAPAPAAAGVPAASAPAVAEDEGLLLVRSPIVGTFYAAPSPGAPDFARPGDTVEAGQVLCIVEAMKLMNEIEAEVAGQIVKRLVTTGQPVEYGQPLFSLRPLKAAGA